MKKKGRGRIRAQEQSPPPGQDPGNDSSVVVAASSCALNYETFHDLLAKLLIAEFDEDKICPRQDGSPSPMLISLEKMFQAHPPVLTRAERSRMEAELELLESWEREAGALIEMKEKIEMDAERREVEMLQLLGGNGSENAPDRQAISPKPHRPSSSIVTGIAITCADSPDFKPKLDRFCQLLSSSGGFTGDVKVSREINEKTSHVIVGSLDENHLARFRSRSFLVGILRGCWMVSPEWVEACLDSGCFVDESEFEVQGDVHAKGGPEKGRRARSQSYSYQDMAHQSLFGSLNVRLMKSTWPPDQMKNYEAVDKVLTVGGARVKGEEDRDAPVTIVFSAKVIIGGAATDNQMGVHTVSYKWVFDSVSHYALIDFDKYSVS